MTDFKGKSTFLQSLLGELDEISGSSSVHLGVVGFCSQDPWLRSNGSIRQNITFLQPYEAQWYQTVIRALAMDVDLENLQVGDATSVSNLSGGQKQRCVVLRVLAQRLTSLDLSVALARVVYGRCDSLILDDVFSALDADTEAHVFNSLLGVDGLLRGRTVILATNQIYRLTNASWITMLSEGHIEEQGCYSDLISANGRTAQLMREFAAGAEEKSPPTAGNAPDALTETAGAKAESTKGKELEDRDTEKSQQGTVKWSTHKLYFRGMGRYYTGACTFLSGATLGQGQRIFPRVLFDHCLYCHPRHH